MNTADVSVSAKGSRAPYLLTLVVLIAVGVLTIVVYRQEWAIATTSDQGLGATTISIVGVTLYPWAVLCGWLVLASAVGVLATRGKGRLVIGVLIILAGAGIGSGGLAFALTERVALPTGAASNAQISTNNLWITTICLGIVAIAAGAAVALYGPGWSSLSSRQSGTQKGPTSAWDALDRGQDPTSGPDLPQ